MDIKKLKATASITIELDAPGPVSITFWVRPIAPDSIIDYPNAKASEALRKLAADAIVDWDITDDEKKLECNEENKAKYLPVIFSLKIKSESDETVLSKLIAFAQDQRNFFVL